MLVRADRARLAEVEAELAALEPRSSRPRSAPAAAARPDPPMLGAERPPHALWRRVGIVGVVPAHRRGRVILVVHFVQARQPGQASSGSVTVSQAQLIEQQLRRRRARTTRADQGRRSSSTTRCSPRTRPTRRAGLRRLARSGTSARTAT